MEIGYREYRGDDFAAVKQIWKECGWIDDDEEGELIRDFIAGSDVLVGTIDDNPECCAISTPGSLQYAQSSLRLGGVSGVTTSHVSRQLGFARKLTARLLARQANDGHAVSGLGMFDQGFYNKVGFGNGSYEFMTEFDPSTINLRSEFRPPKRLTVDDYAAIHEAMVSRRLGHGNVRLNAKEILKAELKWLEKPFGLGYFDGPNGELTHFIFGSMKGEHGPYSINWRAYQTNDQLIELLALIKSLGDQVNVIRTLEMAEFPLQDLLSKPIRTRRASLGGNFSQKSQSLAYWQLRMLDPTVCISRLRTPVDVTFNLVLQDPVTPELEPTEALANGPWRGVGGNYIVQLGSQSNIVPGSDNRLETITSSVNAFSRLWIGSASASSLVITEDFRGPATLIEQLDDAVRLPKPHFGWDF